MSAIPKTSSLSRRQREPDFRQIDTAKALRELHQLWTPHDGQIEPLRDLFYFGIMDIFLECGRNFGKTEIAAYALSRWARTHPGSENYYFGPEAKQVREIIWESNRLRNMLPQHWVASANQTEMRFRLTNTSKIKCDGTDNIDSYRGVKPKAGLIVFDEFKDFHPEFFDVFDANRRGVCPIFVLGTPPDRDGHFTETADEFKENPAKRYYNRPSATNPHLSRKWLADKKEELYKKGEGDKWEREYEAKRVPPGKSKIFPMLTKTMIEPHANVMAYVRRELKRLQFYVVFDPAGASVFAVNFYALNPYTKTILFLDDIYEDRQAEMTARKLGPRVMDLCLELGVRETTEWSLHYDEAASWFRNEWDAWISEEEEEDEEAGYRWALIPTAKSERNKLDGLSDIKSALLGGKIIFSERCAKEAKEKKGTWWEFDNYFKDKKGEIPKKSDHTIDNTRYFLHASGYTLKSEIEYQEAKDPMFRGARIEDDFPHLAQDSDD